MHGRRVFLNNRYFSCLEHTRGNTHSESISPVAIYEDDTHDLSDADTDKTLSDIIVVIENRRINALQVGKMMIMGANAEVDPVKVFEDIAQDLLPKAKEEDKTEEDGKEQKETEGGEETKVVNPRVLETEN